MSLCTLSRERTDSDQNFLLGSSDRRHETKNFRKHVLIVLLSDAGSSPLGTHFSIFAGARSILLLVDTSE